MLINTDSLTWNIIQEAPKDKSRRRRIRETVQHGFFAGRVYTRVHAGNHRSNWKEKQCKPFTLNKKQLSLQKY